MTNINALINDIENRKNSLIEEMEQKVAPIALSVSTLNLLIRQKYLLVAMQNALRDLNGIKQFNDSDEMIDRRVEEFCKQLAYKALHHLRVSNVDGELAQELRAEAQVLDIAARHGYTF